MNFDADKHIKHIVTWIREYFVNNGPHCKAVIGISGGKDSSVAAALCVEALGAEHVLGVKMPQGNQSDIDMANKLIDHLGIHAIEINIGKTCDELYSVFGGSGIPLLDQVVTNTPARIRMTTLYAVAAVAHGRVVNTCNRSEDYIGYSTKFGDSAGDFSPLQQYTVTEVQQMGKALGLPLELVYKTPDDGMSGKSDEEKLGFTYETLDNFLLNNVVPNYATYQKICQLHERNLHKLELMPYCKKPLK